MQSDILSLPLTWGVFYSPYGSRLGSELKHKNERPAKVLKSKNNRLESEDSRRFWLRGRDLNPRPPGYEPDELPAALPRDMVVPETGVEPARSFGTQDFKSRASTNSATPAWMVCSTLAPTLSHYTIAYAQCQGKIPLPPKKPERFSCFPFTTEKFLTIIGSEIPKSVSVSYDSI